MAQQTLIPTRKVIGGGAVGAAVTLVVYFLNNYISPFKTDPLSAEFAALATTVLSAIVAYWLRPGVQETTVADRTTGLARSALQRDGGPQDDPVLTVDDVKATLADVMTSLLRDANKEKRGSGGAARAATKRTRAKDTVNSPAEFAKRIQQLERRLDRAEKLTQVDRNGARAA